MADLWREHGLQPHRPGHVQADFEAKVYAVVGLYLDPPEGAVILSFDEKTHGAFNVGTGHVEARCSDQRRTVEFIEFMDLVVGRHLASTELHVIMDNLSTHDGDQVEKWLTKHPNVKFQS